MDLNAWVKLKYRRRYDLLAPEDRQYYQPTALEDVARVVRRVWRKVTGRRLRKAWRQKRRQTRVDRTYSQREAMSGQGRTPVVGEVVKVRSPARSCTATPQTDGGASRRRLRRNPAACRRA